MVAHFFMVVVLFHQKDSLMLSSLLLLWILPLTWKVMILLSYALVLLSLVADHGVLSLSLLTLLISCHYHHFWPDHYQRYYHYLDYHPYYCGVVILPLWWLGLRIFQFRYHFLYDNACNHSIAFINIKIIHTMIIMICFLPM